MQAVDELTAAAIRATGNEAIAMRLALADQLEERGEPLGEAIRLACVLRELRTVGPKHNTMDEVNAWARKRFNLPPRLSAEAHYDETKLNIVALRPVVLGDLLRACEEAWPKCQRCDGNGDLDPFGADCPDCGCSGRVGKLWRDCPCVSVRNYCPIEEIAVGNMADPRCTRCDGVGVLFERVCPACHGEGLVDAPPGDIARRWSCDMCDMAGYIPSPLAALHERLALLFMPEADGVRRGDVQTILKLLKGSNDGERS